MKLCVRSLALTLGIVWGGCLLFINLVAALRVSTEGGYFGQDFLLAVASVYPGYKGTPELLQALIGGGYGFVDGAIGGAIVACLYNCLAAKGSTS